MITDQDLRTRFTYHPPPDAAAIELYARIREEAFMFARFIRDKTPHTREQALALTHLEETVMWANAAIARGNAPRG